jgi:hypothetical protein
MTIKQIGGIFGRNPTFNDVTIDGQLTFEGDIDINSDLKVDGNLVVDGNGEFDSLDVVSNGIKANANAAIGFQLGGDASGSTDIGKIVNNTGRFAIEPAGNRRFVVRTNATKVDALEVDHNNNVSVPNGNVVMGSGQGIDFSATSGTGTSELFDDYEEGTWTPTFEGSTSGSLVFGSVLQATYFKIGKLVYVNCYLASGNIAGNTVSGNCLIKGLPYTGDPYSSAVTVTQCNLFTFDEEDISISGYCEGSNVRLVRGSRGTNITDSDVGTAGTAGTIMFQMTYGAL